ncbi:Gldg family protein [Sphaerospermopsis sp. FACHB-1094]|nr:Gldg family protein [Sphaerospermopsis sp. FACHB-1094]MBD2133023.1 Gldg family protein [Sphaerospermopsis sp. FACHB-1094]
MKKIPKKNFANLLFLLGPFLLTLGLTVGLISDTWGILPLVFIIAGLLICIVWVFFQAQKNQFWKQRSTVSTTNALVATLAVLTILGLINFLGTRYQLRLDLTETQLFTLAPQSKELLRTLPKPAKVWLFTREQNLQDEQLLENYRRQTPKFNFEYIDPQTRPGLAEKFGVKAFGEVYLEFDNKRQLVQTVNEYERLSEVRLTSRLQQITSNNTAKVYFLQGHGELEFTDAKNAISQAIQGLVDKNFTALPLSLTEQTTVPEDAAVVVVAGPKRELLAGEVTALQDYLNRGGNLMLMVDPNTDPKIDDLLQDWGVKLDNRLAVDVSGTTLGLGPAAPAVTEYGQHPITKDFGNGISFYPLARPILIEPIPEIQSTPLLRTKSYPNSWAESDQQNENLEFNEGQDLKGPLTLGVALTRKLSSPSPTSTPSPTASPSPTPTPTPTASPSPTSTPTPTASPSPTPTPTPTASPTEENSQNHSKESRLVVFGNSDFARDGLFQQQLNGDVFLNSVTWLSQEDQQPLSIRPKEQTNRRITMSTAKANLLSISSLLLLPFIGLATGAIIWWKRR